MNISDKINLGITNLLLLGFLLGEPTKTPLLTQEKIKKLEYIAYDFENDGKIDALGFKNANQSNFYVALFSHSSLPRNSYHRYLTLEEENIALDYYNKNKALVRN